MAGIPEAEQLAVREFPVMMRKTVTTLPCSHPGILELEAQGLPLGSRAGTGA